MDRQSLFNQAFAAHQAGDLAWAEQGYLALLKARPGHPQVTYLLGALRGQQGRAQEAATLLESALKAAPGNSGILLHLGNTLQQLGRFEEAVARYDQAIALKPDLADALNNRGNALRALGRSQEALASFDTALRLQPGNARTWYNRMMALEDMLRFDEALESGDRALAIEPGLAEAHSNKGAILLARKQPEQALASFARALALQPDNIDFQMGQAGALHHLKRYDEALAAYDAVLMRAPDFPHAFSHAAQSALYGLNWPRMAQIAAELPARIAAGTDMHPFVLTSYTEDGALQRQAAQRAIMMVTQRQEPLWQGEHYRHARIRLIYLSHDFRNHPVGYQVADLLERHDRNRFEVIGVSTGPQEDNDISRRLEAGFERMEDARNLRARQLAQLLRRLEADIVIDLGGFTEGSAVDALAFRPAPVQALWLGYPGTSGADFIDYIIADDIVAPPEHCDFYSEEIVRLPGCFFPVDSTRVIAAPPSRAEMDLPEDAFVFCCFNNNWKITAPVFDIWMRLLKQVPGSVLWLREGSQEVLRREAAARGVAPERLIFARHVDLDVHHARHQLADLFLDTLPYNAHTTAADALWAGLPVLTRIGALYPGRVAASLLTAAGVPELTTSNAEAYETMALALARDPACLAAIRAKLKDIPARFDMTRFARDLEAAYRTMLEKARRA